MMHTEQQAFLEKLEKNLWKAADKLRGSIDAANYKHAVLGLIFLKYISDAFEARREEVKAEVTDPKNTLLYINPNDFDSEADYQNEIQEELEALESYRSANIFWIPEQARWSFLQTNAKVSKDTQLEYRDDQGQRQIYKFVSPGKLIDDGLYAVELANPKLKNLLNKSYAAMKIDNQRLSGLIDLIGNIPFNHKELASKDILGHVYEYFLGQFALAEGKKGGQYYTPKSIVSLIVELLQPFEGQIYDPAMGSGGFFIQSERFLREHRIDANRVSLYGQELSNTTWQLAGMNLAIRNLEFDFGKGPADTFHEDLHKDLRADFVMANPPFNTKDWWQTSLEGDKRWVYGVPNKNNANFAWLQHMLWHLKDRGIMALLLANGSMSSTTGTDGEIRKNLVLDNKIDCMIALPGQLFTNTQIPACIWVCAKDRGAGNGLRDRKDEVLFIDARQHGYMKGRVLRDFSEADISEIATTYHAWRSSLRQVEVEKDGKSQMVIYKDIPGFCKSASLAEIREHDFVLTPGRYVGAPPLEEDDEPFAEKMARLIHTLSEQMAESARLEQEIRKNLAGLGYEI